MFQQKPAGIPHLKAKESTLEHPKHLRRFGVARKRSENEQPRAALSQRKNAEDDSIHIYIYVYYMYYIYIYTIHILIYIYIESRNFG